MTAEPEKSKIIVDEDWKSKVQAEKEALHQQQQQTPPPAEESPVAAKEPPAAAKEPPAGARHPLPPPDLFYLAGSLYMQALMGLGAIPNPLSSQPKVELEKAKHAIDTLAMLQQKTEGNRTPEESESIEAMLHELRMVFIAASEQPASPKS
jgi:hypothetical protein